MALTVAESTPPAPHVAELADTVLIHAEMDWPFPSNCAYKALFAEPADDALTASNAEPFIDEMPVEEKGLDVLYAAEPVDVTTPPCPPKAEPLIALIFPLPSY